MMKTNKIITRIADSSRFFGLSVRNLWAGSKQLAGKSFILCKGQLFEAQAKEAIHILAQTKPGCCGFPVHLDAFDYYLLKKSSLFDDQIIQGLLGQSYEIKHSAFEITFPNDPKIVRDFFRFHIRLGLSLKEAAKKTGTIVSNFTIQGEPAMAMFNPDLSVPAIIKTSDWQPAYMELGSKTYFLW